VNKRFLIMGGIAIVFGGLSIVVADFWLKSNVKTVVETVETPGDAPAVAFSTIVAAAEPMRYGTLIDPGMLKELPWPKDDLPAGAFSTVDDLLADGERVALTAIDTNEPILVTKVTDAGEQATLSRRIEDGMRVGGIGTRIRQDLREADVDTAVTEIGLPDEFLDHGSRGDILERVGLTPQHIARDVTAMVLGSKLPHARAVPADEEASTR